MEGDDNNNLDSWRPRRPPLQATLSNASTTVMVNAAEFDTSFTEESSITSTPTSTTISTTNNNSNISRPPTIISANSMVPPVVLLRKDWVTTRMGFLVGFQIVCNFVQLLSSNSNFVRVLFCFFLFKLFGLVSIVCAATPPGFHPPYRSFFLALAGIDLVLSITWFTCHVMNLNNVLAYWPWLLMDLILSLWCQFTYTIAFIVILILVPSQFLFLYFFFLFIINFFCHLIRLEN